MPQRLLLNGFGVEFSADSFSTFVQEMPDNIELKPLRERQTDWFFMWRDGLVYGLPRSARPSRFGQPQTLDVTDLLGLRLLSARLTDLLPRLVGRQALRRKPYTFLGGVDAVETFADRLDLPSLARQFHIQSKFELDVKIVEFVNNEPKLGVILERHTRWSISAALEELQSAGVDLTGLYAVRRETEPGQKRLIGRIARLNGSNVEFDEAYDDVHDLPTQEVALEGTRLAFARCLRTLLGPGYQDFMSEFERWEVKAFAAPQFESLLQKVGGWLQQKPLNLGGIEARVADRLSICNSKNYTSIVSAKSLQCCFDAGKTKRDDWPWRGLERFGPYSRETFANRTPSIWAFCPDASQGQVENFVRMLRDGLTLPDYRGRPQQSAYPKSFAALYGLMNPQFSIKRIGVFGQPRGEMATLYRRAVEDALARESPPHAAIVVVPDEPTQGDAVDNPYLQAKAVLLMAGVPVQEVRLSTVTKAPFLIQNALQNISLALYAKMGGTPWTIANDQTVHDELVIGMGTVELSESRFSERQRFIGITTVFSGEGNYLLGNVSRECNYERYPQVLRDSTLEVLNDIKTRNGWQPGDTIRIVFHAYKPLKDVEVGDIIADCVNTLRGEHEIEFAFLNISQEHPFYLFDPAQRGLLKKNVVIGELVPDRGTIAQLGRYSRLVCARGPRLMRRSAIPQPLLVHLHPASTYNSLDYLAEQVLKFTTLSWRSTQPSRGPVTVYYSELIAGLLARLKSVPDWSPAMLNVKLRSSRWFL